MKHKGLHVHRLKDNSHEKAFAESWEDLNFNDRHLEYLLAEDNNNPGPFSERDAEVAATVIQWLGSPVGMGFLNEVLSKCHLKIVPSIKSKK